MSNYIVEAKSRADLRRLARLFREYLHLDDVLYFPIVELLDVMTELFDDFNYEVVEDNVLPKQVHADTDIRTGHIRIKASVYEGACNGEGRDRMTIAHEIAHYFTLCFCGFRLECNFSGGKIPAFCDPEWQAKCFAGELMIPAHRVKCMDAHEIAEQCGVSYPRYQKKFKAALNRFLRVDPIIITVFRLKNLVMATIR